MMTDALIAFLIISFSVVATHQLLIKRAGFEKSYLHAVTSDTAAIIEASGLNNVQEVLNLAPARLCLSSTIMTYDDTTLVGQETKVSNTCPFVHRGDVSISRRTFIDDQNHIIIIKGWFKQISEWGVISE